MGAVDVTAETHKCEADGCDRQVAREKFMCIDHWRMVPMNLKREVWRVWRRFNSAQRTRMLTMTEVKELRTAQANATTAVREKEIKRQLKNQSSGDNLNFG